MASIVCLVIGSGGLSPDCALLLTDALERAGMAASLAGGGPAQCGAAPAGGGRRVALARFDSSAGLSLLYPPSSAPLDLRKWVSACKAASAAPAPADAAVDALSAAQGVYLPLAALSALLDADAPSLWFSERHSSSTAGSGGGGGSLFPPSGCSVALLCAPPASHVDDDDVTSALATARDKLCVVALACVELFCPTNSSEAAFNARTALSGLAFALAEADNGSFRGVVRVRSRFTASCNFFIAHSLGFEHRLLSRRPRPRTRSGSRCRYCSRRAARARRPASPPPSSSPPPSRRPRGRHCVSRCAPRCCPSTTGWRG